jgi:hypothetical protein
MKAIQKTALVFLLVDLLLYFLLFHSGLVLPWINPTLEEYNNTVTSFPRDYAQKLIWILIHFPTSWLLSMRSDRFLALSVIQYPLLMMGVSRWIETMKKKEPDGS